MEKIKGKFIAAKDKTQAFFEKHKVYCLAVCGVLAFILNLVIESCARHSLTAALGFFVTSPLVFIYNVGLIFIMLAPAIIFCVSLSATIPTILQTLLRRAIKDRMWPLK